MRRFSALTGDLQQKEIRGNEESVRAVGAVRLRDRPDYLQLEQQAVSVCEHRHGQGSSQVHRVQRTPRVPHQQEYHRGEPISPR